MASILKEYISKKFGVLDLQNELQKLIAAYINTPGAICLFISAFDFRTRVESLVPATLEQNLQFFNEAEAMPRRAITMGVEIILDCRNCVLLATGEISRAAKARYLCPLNRAETARSARRQHRMAKTRSLARVPLSASQRDVPTFSPDPAATVINHIGGLAFL